jgi:hypothetical protein
VAIGRVNSTQRNDNMVSIPSPAARTSSAEPKQTALPSRSPIARRGVSIGALPSRARSAKIASRLRPHLIRWRKIDQTRSSELRAEGLLKGGEQIRFVVNRMQDGQPLAGKIRSAWEGILEDAGLGDDVVRHSLRHTAATWLMQAGVDIWEAAGWLGMTVEQLEANYGHHHPDFPGRGGGGVWQEGTAVKRFSRNRAFHFPNCLR